ncbi:MAG: four-carbon acid sugar kinase family protein [Chloroflexi bacterium]|nr:four-carbon acid sugar kinase family protein [Chloroflexota bacterium]
MRLAIIADDLTGAMDTGLQCSKQGLETVVSLDWRQVPNTEVAVVDTDSRAARASEAYRRLCHVAALVRGRRIYKKVDSTMRGNVGYELRALCEVLAPRAIVVAPAFPQGGRTTWRGRQFVEGRPLEQTFFAHDPRWPMTESHLPTLLMQQAGQEIGQIDLEPVEAGPQVLMAALKACPEHIIVVDALEQRHLRTLAQTLINLGPEWLPCGSAGLAEAWVEALGIARPPRPCPPPPLAKPVLVVSGSRNDATLAQIRAARRILALPQVDLDAQNFYDTEREVTRLASACLNHLRQGRDVILTTSFSPLVAGASSLVARILAEATAHILRGAGVAGLFITGGDIAVQICRVLEVRALRILDELQPGIPGGKLVGGPFEGLRVVTKAGGFGNERALLEALLYLHGQLKSATT